MIDLKSEKPAKNEFLSIIENSKKDENPPSLKKPPKKNIDTVSRNFDEVQSILTS